jgi:hypothetical protein
MIRVHLAPPSLATLFAVATGCGGSLDPGTDAGAADADGGVVIADTHVADTSRKDTLPSPDTADVEDVEPVDATPVDAAPPCTFVAVQAVFDLNCATSFCHDMFSPTSMLLAPGYSYDAIVNVRALQDPTHMRVLPGEPEVSEVYLVAQKTPTTATELETIRCWIAAGAPK